MKYINYVGILFISLGFAAPFLTKGLIPCIVLFWLGFLLIMNENENLGEWNTIFKHGKIGLLFNVITLALVVVAYEYFSLRNHWFFTYAHYITNPMDILINKIVPQEMVQLPSGDVLVTISYARSTITTFLNSALFVLVGVIVGKLLTNEKRIC